MTTETPTSEAGGKAAFTVALDGMRVLEASATLERLAGRSAGALNDHPVAELWAASERRAIATRFDDVVIYGRDAIGALALMRPDGSHILVDLEARYAHRGGERLEIVVVPLEGVPVSRAARAPEDGSVAHIEEESAQDFPENVRDEASDHAAESAAGDPEKDALIAVLEAAGLGALSVDPSGKLTSATSLASRILGRSCVSLVGQHVDRLFIFEETMVGVLAQSRAERRRQGLRAGARGGSVHAALEWVPVGDCGGGVLLVREMQPDDEVTDRLKRRQKLADAAAHDARNALDAMAYGFSTLRERMIDEPAMLETIDTLDAGRVQVRAIIDDHLDSVQGGKGVNEAVDLSALLREVLARYSSEARAGGVELRDDLVPDVTVFTDAGRLRRAFENIVDNALRAMPDGGVLALTTQIDDRDRSGVRIEVRDNGIGMAESVRSRIFEQGFTTGEGRRGLGLSSVRDFITSNGGEIECVSAPGRGALIIIWLHTWTG